MATALVFDAASPYSVAATVTGDGAGGATSYTKANLYTGMSNLGITGGPLLALLRATLDWTVFNLGNAQSDRIHVRELINRDLGGQPATFEFFWEAGGFKVLASNVAGAPATGICQIEIRFQHSERF